MSHLSRVERAQVGVRIPVIKALLQTYGADVDTASGLAALAKEATQRGWWHRYGRSIPDEYATYIGFEADADLRDFENVPLEDDVDNYFEREVKPHVPDAWMDRSKDKVGYEINFNQHFYVFTPPRSLAEIDADLKRAEEDVVRLLR